MHLHLARAGADMTLLSDWAPTVIPKLQRVPRAPFDQRRSTWTLPHVGMRRFRRARLLVDYLSAALMEGRAEFIGRCRVCWLKLDDDNREDQHHSHDLPRELADRSRRRHPVQAG